MDYTICSMMLKGRLRRRINLDEFYEKIWDAYQAEYEPEITNRIIVHLDEASVLFFSSGTIQVYLKNPEKKEETIKEIGKMLDLDHPTPLPSF